MNMYIKELFPSAAEALREEGKDYREQVHKDRLRTIIERIEANPTCWNQIRWHCNTAHCIAGHAQLDAGHAADDYKAERQARDWLGLLGGDAQWLFTSWRTLPELKRAVDLPPSKWDEHQEAAHDTSDD